MSLYEQLRNRRRKVPFVYLGVIAVVVMLFVLAGRYPSRLTLGLLLIGVFCWFAALWYLNSLMCCPRCHKQVLPWYGIAEKPIPRICRVCGLDFATIESNERTI